MQRSQPDQGYLGAMGVTTREAVHYACPCGNFHCADVLVSVDARADAALARSLVGGQPPGSARCPQTGTVVELAVPFVYHDSSRQLFALVLPVGHRHRDLAERARLFQRLADDSGHPPPAYVVDFSVVYGAEGLRARLKADSGEVGERTERLAADEEVITSEVPSLEPGDIAPAASARTEDSAVGTSWPGGRDPVARAVGDDGIVRMSIRAGRADKVALASEPLAVRLQLHRMPTGPLVTIALGSSQALDGAKGAGSPVWIPLDPEGAEDRVVLAALERSFAFELTVFDRDGDKPVMAARTVRANLAGNLRYVMSAARAYARELPAGKRSFAKAMAAFLAPDHDRLGLSRSAPIGNLAAMAIERPSDLARALDLVRQCSVPDQEDWLIAVRGYPLDEWTEWRRRVIGRAVDHGFWLGTEAAQIAVREGLARSRKELIVTQQRAFAHLLESKPDHGLPAAFIPDNWAALKADAKSLGISAKEWAAPRSEPIVSEAHSMASGTIGQGDEKKNTGKRAPSSSDLIHQDDKTLLEQLGGRDTRLRAAIELCRRGSPSSIQPVFEATSVMSRAEAVRVLGSAVGFGKSAEQPLLELLASRKSYLRQGAALALAMIGSEAGTEALCDRLVSEPTEIWRELARALGEIGEPAVMPLLARLASQPETSRERVAWALAHIGARGAQRPLETLAKGRDPVAAGVARHALELVDLAKSDQLQVRGSQAPRDQTVNRAFSRQFFAAMAADPVPAAIVGDLSAPAMLLDESDLLETDELDTSETELGEADLLPGDAPA